MPGKAIEAVDSRAQQQNKVQSIADNHEALAKKLVSRPVGGGNKADSLERRNAAH